MKQEGSTERCPSHCHCPISLSPYQPHTLSPSYLDGKSIHGHYIIIFYMKVELISYSFIIFLVFSHSSQLDYFQRSTLTFLIQPTLRGCWASGDIYKTGLTKYLINIQYLTKKPNLSTFSLPSTFYCTHTSYLSPPAVVYFFQAGVPF